MIPRASLIPLILERLEDWGAATSRQMAAEFGADTHSVGRACSYLRACGRVVVLGTEPKRGRRGGQVPNIWARA